MRRLVLLLIVLLSARVAVADESNRRLVLRLQYIATDYRGAVPAQGHVANQAEYDENLQTAQEAVQLYRRLKPDGPQTAVLVAFAQQLEMRTSPDIVEETAKKLVERLRLELNVTNGPLFWPELNDGAKAYAENCASCHGAQGRGDGPAAAALSPKPPDLTSPAWADRRSPFQIFNTVTLGIPNTAMAPFEKTIDHNTRWSLAFYLLTLRAPAKPVESRPWLGVIELASATNEEIAQRLQLTSDVDTPTALAVADAARRTPPRELTIGAAMSRMSAAIQGSMSLVRQNRRLEASDVVAQTYYDAVEPVEPALMQLSPSDLPEMEIRITALRAAISEGKSIEVPAKEAFEVLGRIYALAPDPQAVESLQPRRKCGAYWMLEAVVLAAWCIPAIVAIGAWLLWRRFRTRR